MNEGSPAINNYSFRMMVYEAHIDAEPMATAPMDPYIVGYLSDRDRTATKQKAKSRRRTYHPVWNHVMEWSGLDYTEKIRLELKYRSFPQNAIIGSVEFSVQDVLKQMNIQLGQTYCLPLEPKGEVIVSFNVNPPIPADACLYNMHDPNTPGADRAGALMNGENPAYVAADGFFACVLLDGTGQDDS